MIESRILGKRFIDSLDVEMSQVESQKLRHKFIVTEEREANQVTCIYVCE